MIEGVFQVGQLCARDILVPRAQIDWIDINLPLSELIKTVIEAAHSRFPVFEGSRDNVIGILLAKDLLRHVTEKDFQVRDWLRPAVFIPESKRLSVLLRDFKDNRNHLAVVVDEYSGIAGIITIEDVLEQIVGDIEDEHDIDEEADNIISLDNGDIRVKGITELEQLNEALGTKFAVEDIETVAGLVVQHLGRVPKIGELITIDGVEFEVQRADPRQVHILLARQIAKTVD
jgi:magnesium and cobalt transporter